MTRPVESKIESAVAEVMDAQRAISVFYVLNFSFSCQCLPACTYTARLLRTFLGRSSENSEPLLI